MADPEAPRLPAQTPLFHAQHASRYDRQRTIAAYEQEFSCRLIVMIDAIFPDSIPLFEELLFDADADDELLLLLASPGGDGETAVRLARSAQARCAKFTVVVPDQAKSAATLLALGADEIMMGPTSDLGPVDPQFRIGSKLVSAKNILSALEQAETAIKETPETYPLYASLLSDVDLLMIEHARSEMARTDELLVEALSSVRGRSQEAVAQLATSLHDHLVEQRATHAAMFSATDAIRAGLPVVEMDPRSRQWEIIWRLYATYVVLGSGHMIYESSRASQIHQVALS